MIIRCSDDDSDSVSDDDDDDDNDDDGDEKWKSRHVHMLLTLALISGYKFCNSSSSFLSTTHGSSAVAFPFPLLFASDSARRFSSLVVFSSMTLNALL